MAHANEPQKGKLCGMNTLPQVTTSHSSSCGVPNPSLSYLPRNISAFLACKNRDSSGIQFNSAAFGNTGARY